MKISANVLKRFCAGTPAEPKALRRLLDDLGVEVKRLDVQGADALLTLELLANRGDHHCYAGVARETNALTAGFSRSRFSPSRNAWNCSRRSVSVCPSVWTSIMPAWFFENAV